MRNLAVKILNMLAVRIVGKYKPVIIAVTGSTGKSTTSKVIGEVLGSRFAVRYNDVSSLADLSIPLAIIGEKSGRRALRGWIEVFRKALQLVFVKSSFYPDVLIFDIEVRHPGDMKKTLKVIRPNIAVFTGVGEFPPHMQNFKSAKAVAREMSLLFRFLQTGGLAVLNIDDNFIKNFAKNIRAEKVKFGFGKEAVLRGEEIFWGKKKWKTNGGQIGMSFKVGYKGVNIPFRFNYALGRGQVYAALAGAAVGIHLGMNMVEISQALENFRPLPGRMDIKKGANNSIIIDDTFNSNLDSVIAALETMEKLDAVRKIAVFGDMMDLGKYSKEAHKKAGERIPACADMLLCCGKMSRCFCEVAKKKGMDSGNAVYFNDKQELIQELKKDMREGDIVLVKGAREMKMEKVVEELTVI